MKGISLSIETVIHLILAALALTVLLYFFTSTAGDAEDRVKLEKERTGLCEQYVQLDPACDEISVLNNFGKRSRLGEVCENLNIVGCSQTPDLTCIKRCCIFCTKRA